MDNHYFDEKGVYTGSAAAYEGTLPPENALRVAPPEREGYCAVLNAARDGWELVEDHRGAEGWVGERHVKVAAPGPLPAGWSANRVVEDRRTVSERRRDDFAVEADPMRDAALSYLLESEAQRQAGNRIEEERAMEKYHLNLAAYLGAKETVRRRHPASVSSA